MRKERENMTFKVGDLVRLTGPGWSETDLDRSDFQLVEKLTYDGFGVIHGGWVVYDREGDDWAAEKVESQTEVESSSFEQNVRRITSQIADLLIEKNAAYGDSALNPIRVFSKSDRIEQLNVRIDDKISRIQRGSEYGEEDTEMDLIGYLVLRKIARESE